MSDFYLLMIASISAKLMTNNSKSYKRPVSVRRTNLDPADKKFDLVYVLDHLRYLASLLIILFFNLALRYHLAKLDRAEALEDRTLEDTSLPPEATRVLLPSSGSVSPIIFLILLSFSLF